MFKPEGCELIGAALEVYNDLGYVMDFGKSESLNGQDLSFGLPPWPPF